LFSDAPTVEQEQTFIHTRENDETEVVCTVHASPKAEVAWFKNGQPLTKDQGIFSQRGNRHTLLLTGSKVSTFGIYTCRATNKFGSDERTTEVSGNSDWQVVGSNISEYLRNMVTKPCQDWDLYSILFYLTYVNK